jgi:shikimate dehydrogenase
MKKACVIGWPIAQSRSPLIHNYWIHKHGLDAIYEKVAVEPKDLNHFVSNFKNSGLVGCNVTVPHKENVFNAIANIDEPSRRLGALNTLYVRNGIIHGTNTDGEGFMANLRQNHPTFGVKDCKAIIIGAGGAAKAIIGALIESEVREISIVNRTPERIENLKKQFGTIIKSASPASSQTVFAECDLLINTSSLGMVGQPPLEIDIDGLPEKAIIADIIYSPLETPFLKAARLRGNPTLEGLGMLLHQAVRGFELWFGVKPEVTTELRDLVAADVKKAHA